VFLADLTNLNGVSGNEDAVRAYICSKIQGKVDDIKVDSMGNLIAWKKGRKSKLKVMLAAHMDEVGFMVTGFGDMGSLKFKPVGGIDHRILPGQRVLVGDSQLPGIIGVKPIHQQDKKERDAVLAKERLFIDIGADKKEEAEKWVNLGDAIYFPPRYEEFGEGCVRAKALDDRVGCSILMEILEGSYDCDIYACFTVQEEVGLRGAEIAAFQVNPDLAIVLEGTTCADLPEVEKHEYCTVLGAGPALTIMDGSSIVHQPLMRFIEDCAKKHSISYQFKQTVSGGNDAGKIQRSRAGVRVAVVSVPVRYLHTPVSVMKKSDYEDMKKLMQRVLEEITPWEEENQKRISQKTKSEMG
jgi:putative aminopeptidase FrvX